MVKFNPYKDFLEKHGINQEELANEMGLSRVILNKDLGEQKNLIRIEFALWKMLNPSEMIRDSEMLKVEGRPRERCLICRNYDNKKVNVRIASYDNRFKKGDFILGYPIEDSSAYYIVGKYNRKGRLYWEKPVEGTRVDEIKTGDLKLTDQQRKK